MMRLTVRQDLDALRQRYRAEGVVQVRDVLHPEDAERLHTCLQERVPWGLAYYDQGPQYLRAAALAELGEGGRAELEQRIYEGAVHAYQYAYGSYPMLDAYLQKWGEVPLLDRYLEFLNSEPMLSLVQAITDDASIIKADAQATRYGPGQFLCQHVDVSREGERWSAAHVLNLTPAWEPDWGGYLQLYDDAGDVWRAFRPRFNVLNLLRVPQPHSVTMVTPFAGAPRFAITGWFRSR